MWLGSERLAYEALWGSFVAACEQSGCIVKPRLFQEAIQCENGLKKGTTHQVTSLFYLRELPFRGGDASGKLDVLVRAQEVISSVWDEIESSHVTVAYIQMKKNKAQLLQSVHYDFEGEVQSAHPWFHAQLGVDCLDDNERRKLGCVPIIGRDICRPVKSLRIATAHMGLAGILLGLAADHLKKTVFATVIEKAKEQAGKFPPARFTAMQKRLQRNPDYFTNLFWFQESD